MFFEPSILWLEQGYGAPVFVGEWGTNPDRAGPAGDGYFLRHQSYQDEFHFGAALWTWRESCGDPHKAGEFRAGLIPQVWGEFDVDCTTNEVRGERTQLIQELTRATLRVAPGRIETMEYADASGEFRAQGLQAMGGELVVFYPSARFGRPAIRELQGLTNQAWHEAPGGNDYLTADNNGSEWRLELIPNE